MNDWGSMWWAGVLWGIWWSWVRVWGGFMWMTVWFFVRAELMEGDCGWEVG